MAVILPSTINGVPYPAEVMRRNMGAAFAQSSAGAVRSGVIGFPPSASLSGSTVNVGAFSCVVGSAKGAYLTGLDSVTSAGSLGVADPTNPRRDRVVLEVLDPDNGGASGVREGRLRLIAGTPGALPGLPALPVNALHVAEVLVPRAGAGGPVLTVTPQLTAAVGAPVPVRDVEDRSSLAVYNGLRVARLDLGGREQVYSGGSWRSPAESLVEAATSDAPVQKRGVVTVQSDANGAAAFRFGSPFPTRILGAVLTQANAANLGVINFMYDEGLSNRERVAFFVHDAAGNRLRNTTGIRMVFDAWGD